MCSVAYPSVSFQTAESHFKLAAAVIKNLLVRFGNAALWWFSQSSRYCTAPDFWKPYFFKDLDVPGL